MGRIRFKLSLVMPHSWFYKHKEVSKTGDGLAYNSSSLLTKQLVSAPNKVSYTSPINHKAIDIPFPSETPKKNPLADVSVAALASFPEDIAILSPLNPVEISVDYWPFINISSNKSNLDNTIMEEYAEIDRFHGFSSPHMSKSGLVNTSATFDAEELERKLKAVGTEGRRRYYASPMLSGTLPSPIFEGSHAGWGAHGSDEASRKQDLFRGTDIIRKSPMRVVAGEGKLFDGGGRGEGVYRSSNESNSLRQSTSSSDTGLDRGSSSVWERDIFSINSDGSEAFATGEDGGSNHMNMQRTARQQQHRKPKEKLASPQRSPLMYANGHIDSSNYHEITSGFYEDHHSGVVHAENGNGRSLYKNRENSAVRSDIHMYANSSRDSRNNTHGHSNDIIAMTHNDTTIDSEWGGFNSSDYRTPVKPSPTNSMSSLRGRHNADKYHQELHHEQGFQLPLVQYEASEPRSKRVSSNGDQFSYMGCKERLLSGRMSFEQSNDKAASEGEVEKMSNYDKFKLRQKNGASAKVNTTGSFSPDLGPYRSMPSIDKMSRSADLPKYESYQSTPEHHTKGPSQRSPLFDYSKSSPNRKGSNGGLNNTLSHTHEQGPSWSNKPTLKAVREKKRDPGFQCFSTNAPGGVRSRVFDSFAMVKCSYDPKQDFKESMVEMIFEKNLNSSYDMVELLQCYLTLNPAKCHDTIVKVFTEVWSEIFQDA